MRVNVIVTTYKDYRSTRTYIKCFTSALKALQNTRIFGEINAPDKWVA